MTSRTSPPYDVFGEDERARYAALSSSNIVYVDYPLESDGPDRYAAAASILANWLESGVLRRDASPSLTLYRMEFVDEAGRERRISGVVGGLEVVDEGAGGVLPHERTTPKAKTDRLDLTRATRHNLSPVWGLSLTPGLTMLLEEPGEVYAVAIDEGVRHSVERISDPERIELISSAVADHPVLIADGHHRYAISRTYRDESRVSESGARGAELTMTFIQELLESQLSVAAIHRLYDLDVADLMLALDTRYEKVEEMSVGPATIARMDDLGCICVVSQDGRGILLKERPEAFADVRELDSARLESALSTTPHTVTYQHGVTHVLEALGRGSARSAVLIRPVSLSEIRRTAETGELMPPKSTFFTPKLRTGMVLRPIE